MPRLEIDAFVEDERVRERIRSWIVDKHFVGFCLFSGTPERVVNVITELQALALYHKRNPLIFSADCEWGLPMRLREGGTEFPEAMALAHADNADGSLISQVGKAIADEMRALGLHWNFSPVADVNSNPMNPIINTRAFSGDPQDAARGVRQMVAGTQSVHVAATAKHFPGHGDTSLDSHHALPFIQDGLRAFELRELIPFAAAITEGVRSVMLGHIATPKLVEELGGMAVEFDLPATLSRTLVQKLLREKMNFGGVVVTDAMEMPAITDRYSVGDAALKAAKAGVDVILMPSDPDLAFEAMLDAAKSGGLDRGEMLASHERIRQLREWVSPVANPQLEHAMKIVGSPEHRSLALEVAQRAIGIEGDRRALNSVTDAVIVIDDRDATREKAAYFMHEIIKGNIVEAGVVLTAREAMERVDLTDAVVTDKTLLVTFHRARGYLGGGPAAVTMPDVMRTIADKCREKGIRLSGMLEIGSPYLDLQFRGAEPKCIVKTFSESRFSVEAVLQLLRKD